VVVGLGLWDGWIVFKELYCVLERCEGRGDLLP
jgi:hypothetical protein